MLREVLEDVVRKGEQLKKDVVKQVLHSAVLNEILGSQQFAKKMLRMIPKREIGRLLQKNFQEVLRAMSIPTRQQLATYEKRIVKVEQLLNRIARQNNRPKKRSR